MKIHGFDIIAKWTDTTFPVPSSAIILGRRQPHTNYPVEYVVGTIDCRLENPTEWYWGSYFLGDESFHRAQCAWVDKAITYGLPTNHLTYSPAPVQS